MKPANQTASRAVFAGCALCGLGPFFLGFIVAAAGYRVMFWQCALVALLALAYYHFAHGRNL